MLEYPLKCVNKYVYDLCISANVSLSNKQTALISKLLTGMILLGSFKLSKIAALFLLQTSPHAMHGMLRRSGIPFRLLFWGGLKLMFQTFGIRTTTVQIDDTERVRSKNCKILPFVRKTICKVTGGWVQAQNIVFIVLVTDKVTFPCWFYFHRPAVLTKAQKKICKKNPKKIKEFDPSYRTKVDLAYVGLFVVSRMLKKLEKELGISVQVKSVAGDNGFACSKIQQAVTKYFGCQYVSKANPNQKVMSRGKSLSLGNFFKRIGHIKSTVSIRGRDIPLEYKAARVFISSYGRKVFVVAVRYQGERAWQYLFGTDLTWKAESIIKAYGLRWLVEVFFEDWKQHDGWGVGALQRSEDGAVRGVFLSLLTDLFLLYVQNIDDSLQEHGRNELYSAGTVIRQLQAKAIHQAIEGVLEHDNPRKRLAEIQSKLLEVTEKRVSLKHARQWNFNDLGPSKSLQLAWGRENLAQSEKQRLMMSC